MIELPRQAIELWRFAYESAPNRKELQGINIRRLGKGWCAEATNGHMLMVHTWDNDHHDEPMWLPVKTAHAACKGASGLNSWYLMPRAKDILLRRVHESDEGKNQNWPLEPGGNALFPPVHDIIPEASRMHSPPAFRIQARYFCLLAEYLRRCGMPTYTSLQVTHPEDPIRIDIDADTYGVLMPCRS